MDAIRFVKREHETAREEFTRLEHAARQERAALWRKLKPALEVHEQIEDAALYEPLARDARDRDVQLAEWKDQHARQVKDPERLMHSIDSIDPEDEQWLERVKELRTALEHHIHQEEHEIFPRIALVWNRDRLDRAGADLERMKGERTRLAA